MKRRLTWSVLLATLVMAAGCGDGGSGGALFACTTGSGAGKSCFEIASNVIAPGGLDAAKMDCTNAGGVVSATCSHEGADGGCKQTTSSGSAMISETFWYYTGNAANEMQTCLSAGNTWIAP